MMWGVCSVAKGYTPADALEFLLIKCATLSMTKATVNYKAAHIFIIKYAQANPKCITTRLIYNYICSTTLCEE